MWPEAVLHKGEATYQLNTETPPTSLDTTSFQIDRKTVDTCSVVSLSGSTYQMRETIQAVTRERNKIQIIEDKGIKF